MNFGAMPVLGPRLFSLVFGAVTTALSGAGVASEWQEVGDARDLLPFAQRVVGVGELTRLTGTLNNNGLDIDLYEFRIRDAATAQRFSVLSSVSGSPNARAALYLFDGAGRLVVGADGITATSLPGSLSFAPTTAGTYYLGIAPVAIGPFGQQSGPPPYALFNQYGVIGNFGPGGPGGGQSLASWGGSYYPGSVSYSLSIAGASMIPEPSVVGFLCVGMSLLAMQRRRHALRRMPVPPHDKN